MKKKRVFAGILFAAVIVLVLVVILDIRVSNRGKVKKTEENSEKKISVQSESVKEEETENNFFGEITSEAVESEKEEDSTDYLTSEEPVNTGHIVVIDAGHQSKGNSETEPNAPGSSVMKAKVTGGTRGTTTGVYEYQLNLDIALKLQAELQNRGYEVYMTRTGNDVNISNAERAEYAKSVGGEIFIRIHANGSDNSGVSGALSLAPSLSNPYVSGIGAESQRLSKCVLDAYCAATGMKNQGVVTSDTMTGINWCTMPVTIMEMGYMTNPSDDTNMENEAFQTKMVSGMADGIDAYFMYY